ncbi:lysosomal thioesterase PPT2-like [Mya arenaria]|uniref:lysosomal thioesterase PPT2-like n=2 Tax=Mya arenaria TaxID=6604 RepID=UPI0022E7C319|nr:lysosomal thioesterase PPT2-like [Mya arenaria]
MNMYSFTLLVRVLFIATLLFHIPSTCHAYKPILYMHGILATSSEGDMLKGWIVQDQPGTEVLSINAYNGADSVVNIMEQIQVVGRQMKTFMDKHSGGVNMICFSQGGVICRGVLEQLVHNVDTFISVSSPQAGQFGDTTYLKYLFPHLLRDEVYKVAYSNFGQNISVGNYWNDPRHQDMYLEWSRFLAVVNNQSVNPLSQDFKSNFLRLNRLVMIGGPDDGVITPWQSSHFGFFDANLNVIEMENQPWYIDDWFGLRTLAGRGGLVTHVVPGVSHRHWITNHTVYRRYILPYLQ